MNTFTQFYHMENKGVKIVREMIENKVISQYRLAREMGVSDNAVRDWLYGKYFCIDKHLPRLLEVREKYMRAKGMGIYS